MVVSLILLRTSLVVALILRWILTLRSRATKVEFRLIVFLILLLILLLVWSSRWIVAKNICQRDAHLVLLLGWCRRTRAAQKVKEVTSSCLTSGRLLLLLLLTSTRRKEVKRITTRLTLTVMLMPRVKARHRIRDSRRSIRSSLPVRIRRQRIKALKGLMVSLIFLLCPNRSTVLVELTIAGIRLIVASLSIVARLVVRLKLVERVRVSHRSLVVVLVGLVV